MGAGNQGVLWGNQERDVFCRGFHCPIVYIHVATCVRVCMCQHPFLMSVSFVCCLVERPGESYFSIFERRDRHCFPFPSDTVLL